MAIKKPIPHTSLSKAHVFLRGKNFRSVRLRGFYVADFIQIYGHEGSPRSSYVPMYQKKLAGTLPFS